ncbi:MAG: PAS domain-containing protein [Methylovulum sp.]|nr:MAG: PAS domain-containing protein [Methylovulum sp.]
MKSNIPVTDVEYILADNDSIVSKTDLRGTITYINDDFVRISGFTQQELINTPHSIVRHPDMPPEAFADLWKSLKAGRPWTGMVKNRCKNGDYYWVMANVTPIHENNQLVGYMSVRSKPDYAQIKAADDAYRLFRAGKAGRLKIQDGKIVRSSLLESLKLFKNITIKTRLVCIISLLSLLLFTIGGMGLLGMDRAKESLQTVYEDRTIPMNQISSILRLQMSNWQRLTLILVDPTPVTTARNIAEVQQNTDEISRLWTAYMGTYLTADEKKLADQFAEQRKYFLTEGLQPAIAALRNNDITLAKTLVIDKIGQLYEPVRKIANTLMQLQIDVAKQEYQAAQTRYENTRNIAIGLVASGVTLVLWLGVALIRAVVRPLNSAVSDFSQIAQGNYYQAIEIERQDEIGKVMAALKSMQIKLGFDVAETRRISDENLRVKIALDNVSTGVMIADNRNNIIYTNKSVVDMLGKAEADIRKQLPHFSANRLIGTSIDNFHKKPSHQAQLLTSLTGTYSASMEVGGRTMLVTASPVINEQGQRLGTVAEWQDRTNETATEKELADMVDAAAQGDFTKRIDTQDKEGFFKQLGESFNQLMQTSETGLSEVVRVLDALSRGDLTENITNEYSGTFGQLKDDANSTVDKLKDIIQQIKEAADSINTGAREIAMGNNDLSYRTEEQAASLEQTAASMEELTSAVQHNAANAEKANQLAINAAEVAGKGGVAVGQVVTTMEDINASSRKIVDIISVIDSIAFQTNILALNAAVEAARAGDQGKGFAVVAVEVRNLAQRAAEAAGEIKSLIGDSVDKVEEGSKLVSQAGKTMQEIVTSIHGVTVIMSEITAASAEQSAGIKQVNQAISQMDDVTQQNAALVEQAAAAAESLEQQAQSLTVTVGSFKLNTHARHLAGLKPY